MNLSAQRKNYKNEWMYLKLFVDSQEEEEAIERFISKENKFFIKYLFNKVTNDRESFVKEGTVILEEISSIMETLRLQFQKILTAQSNVMKYNEKERKT